MSYTARRISEELASNKSKKLLVIAPVKNEDEPVIVLDAKTSQPGKHGAAKTALRVRNYFTGKVSEVILTATQKMGSLKDHPLYTSGEAIVLNYDPVAKIVEVVTMEQEILKINAQSEPKKTTLDYECWDNRYYKLKEGY